MCQIKCGNVSLMMFGANVMSRLTIDITAEQHQSLKTMAASEGKTIKQYTLERLFPTSDPAWQELKALLQQRVQEGLSGKLSTKSVAEVLAEELAEDESA